MRRWTHPRTTTLPARLIIVKSVAELHGALMIEVFHVHRNNITILIIKHIYTQWLTVTSSRHGILCAWCIHRAAHTYVLTVVIYYYDVRHHRQHHRPPYLQNKFACRFKTPPRRKEHTRRCAATATARVCSLRETMIYIFYRSNIFWLKDLVRNENDFSFFLFSKEINRTKSTTKHDIIIILCHRVTQTMAHNIIYARVLMCVPIIYRICYPYIN